MAIWELIRACPPLDTNSAYANLLQCTHFGDTCVVAEREGRIIGWISGYRPPSSPARFFVWQVAVHEEARGIGLGGRMLAWLLERPAVRDARTLITTITEDNAASWGLFTRFAKKRGLSFVTTPLFERDTHFQGRHDTEIQLAIRLSNRAADTTRKGFSMTQAPKPSAQIPDIAIYDRRESQVRSYARSMPRQFNRAEGVWMHDNQGGTYLDFLAGCSTLNYGHNHPVLKQALLDYISADGVAHGLDLHTDAKAKFLSTFETLILKPRGLDYRAMFPGPTGTNAVEAALKLARKVTGRQNVIAFTNGFHGMTLGALSATGNAGKRGGAGVPLAHVSHEAYDGYYGPEIDTADLLARRLEDGSSGVDAPAAILVETVQGEGGLNACSMEWLKKIAAIARQHGALFIVDDIQAGCGRTGNFFSFEPAGIKPDIVTMAKSLSGMGLPFAITLVKPEYDQFKPGEHNGTFRGNNHAFVTATAALGEFWRDDRFAEEVRRKGEYLGQRLREIADAHGLTLRGRGMMQGINVGSGDVAEKITAAAFRRGVIIETSGADDEIVKVLAPLVIDDESFASGLDILAESVAEAVGGGVRVAAE